MNDIFHKVDLQIVGFMKSNSGWFARLSLFVVFFWFGLLKIFYLSPANDLVAKTVYWFNPVWFIPFLGFWEVLIGVCFLYRPLIRPGIFLMALQMIGTFLPLILLPEITFTLFPFIPSLEGQYIIKNLVLIALALFVGSHLRDYGGRDK